MAGLKRTTRAAAAAAKAAPVVRPSAAEETRNEVNPPPFVAEAADAPSDKAEADRDVMVVDPPAQAHETRRPTELAPIRLGVSQLPTCYAAYALRWTMPTDAHEISRCDRHTIVGWPRERKVYWGRQKGRLQRGLGEGESTRGLHSTADAHRSRV